MEHYAASIPDWRDDAGYAALVGADRSVLAWEWLRRDAGYRLAAGDRTRRPAPDLSAGEWGLHRFENPALAAPLARPMWSGAAFDAVLTATVIQVGAARPLTNAPAGGASDTPVRWDEALALAADAGYLTQMGGAAARHALLSDGLRAIRFDLAGDSIGKAMSQTHFLIPGPPYLGPQLLALRRLNTFFETGRLTGSSHAPEPRAARQVLLLRTADALADGANQRTIATALLDPAAACPGWRLEHPYLRLQAQRLVRDARASLAGGYRRLLTSS